MPTYTILPSGAALGADVSGLDLRQPLDEATVAGLRTAFLEHCVLRFRDQQLSKADQVRFSSYFGHPVPHPTNTRDRDPDFAELTVISNIEEDGRALGALGNAELAFHADLVFLYEPGTVSILYCVETPASGGDTMWTNGYAGYETLDAATKARIDGLQAVYVHTNPAYNPDPPATHPLVTVHPETGRKTLFISPNAARGIVGWGATESRELLDQLFRHATQDRFVWRHQWRPGDLLMWDNRCTLHRRDSFDNRQRRLMLRTQMVGRPSR